MPLSTDGQWGPEALLDGAGNADPGAQVTVPSGYTATVDARGNLTIIGPPADAVAITVTATDGTQSAYTITVPAAVAELDAIASQAGGVPALDTRLDVVEAALPDKLEAADLTAAIEAERTSERAHQSGTYVASEDGDTFTWDGQVVDLGGIDLPPGAVDGQLLAVDSGEPDGVGVVDAVALADPGTSAHQPADPGTPTTGSLDVAARADHVHHISGALWWLGDGGHGDLVFDGTTAVVLPAYGPHATATITPSAGVYTLPALDIFARDLTVNAGVRVRTNGRIIHVKRNAVINGRIDSDGSNASGATGGAGGLSADHQLSSGGAGATGGTGAGAASALPPRNAIARGRAYAVGGAGGGSGATSGGSGGSNPLPQDNYAAAQLGSPPVMLTGYYPGGTATGSLPGAYGGGAGAGDGTNAGGGGGGGGGVVIVNARRLSGSGVIAARGGNGANGVGGNAGGGGGGGGGVVFVNTTDIDDWTGTVSAAAGTSGTGSGTGSNGGTMLFSTGLAKVNLFS